MLLFKILAAFLFSTVTFGFQVEDDENNGNEDLEKEPSQNGTDLEVKIGQECDCGQRNYRSARSSRIVGGVVTSGGEIPWRVALYIYLLKDPQRGSICSGTIISPQWILTAAHCTRTVVRGRHGVQVYVGAQANPVTVGGGRRVEVERIVDHPSYNSGTLDNDIALVKLANPLTYDRNVSAACLPFGHLSRSSFQGFSIVASGWGTTKPVRVNQENRDRVAPTLRRVQLPVLSSQECSKYQSVTSNMICTLYTGRDTCQGDSGGSIDYKDPNGKYYAIGIVSHGQGCAQRNRPGVYTKVNNYLPWITQTTGETYCGS